MALVVAALLGGGTAVVIAACGFDGEGTADATDEGGSGLNDGGVPDTDVPVACKTLDAACLGTLTPEWKPVALGATCGAGFQGTAYVENPKASPNSCACGACRVLGAFTCTGNTSVSGGNTCDDDPIAQAPPGACTNASAQHIEGRAPRAAGSPGCFAPNDAGSGASGDPLNVCVPTRCDADFCGGSSRCIIADGNVACPSGFTLHGHPGKSVDPGCAPCACDVDPPTDCTGTITAYDEKDCADSGLISTYKFGTCNTFGSGNYDSVKVKLYPPDASCIAQPIPASGEAGVTGEVTICCR